jgi:hypothetical protein
MNTFQRLSSILAVFIFISACTEDIESNDVKLLGRWNWIQSTGGFNGLTITPETEGTTKSLKITNTYFRAYEGDSLIFESEYSYMFDTLYGQPEYLLFKSGGAAGVKFSHKRLELVDLCDDCFTHYFERK